MSSVLTQEMESSRLEYELLDEFHLIAREESVSNGRRYTYMSGQEVKKDPVCSDDHLRVRKKETIPIFTCDGGGTRLAFSLEIGNQLEKDLASQFGKPDFKLAHAFKLFGGTSSGAIASLAMNILDPNNEGEPLYGMQYLNEKFNEIAPQIFPRSYWHSFNYYFRNRPRYDRAGFREFTKTYFKEVLAKDSLRDFVVPTYQLNSHMKTRFITKRATQEGMFKDMTCAQLLECTTAAPTYFEPAVFEKLGFIDGGTFANNPTHAAWIEANDRFGPDNHFVICSVGTGIHPTSLDLGDFQLDSQNWGLMTWALNIFDLESNGVSESTHELMATIYGKNPGYYRWQSEVGNIYLDETNPLKLNELRDKAKELIEAHEEMWRQMVIDIGKVENTESYAIPIG